MVNVLPQATKRSHARRYYAHLVAVALFLTAGVFFVGGALLIPSYLLSTTQADSYERYRDALSGSIGLKEREKTEIVVLSLAERLRILSVYSERGRVVDALASVLARQPEEIAITGIAAGRADGGFTISLQGVAETRSDLLAFVDTLRENTALVNVTLPVSQLVVEQEVPFSISAEFRNAP